MSHDFDHGLFAPLRAVVRDGIVTALAPLLSVNGGYLVAIEPFAGTIRGRGDEDGIDRAFDVLKGRSPSLLVAVGDKTYDKTGIKGYQWDGDLSVQILFLSMHGGSLEARLSGDTVSTASDDADPGIEVTLEHVEQLLIGRNLSIGSKVHELQPVSEEELDTDKHLTLWVQSYRISISRDVTEHRAALQAITEFTSLWRGKPAPASATEYTFQALTDVSP